MDSGFTTLEDLSQEDIAPQPPSQAPKKPKSWLESKKIAYIILAVGMTLIIIIFYYLFHSIGVI